jgi:hypothetical protein
MQNALHAERKWTEGGWWHTDQFDVGQMVYSHNHGIDDQGWFADYLAVRRGTGDWWLRENASTHYVCATSTVEGAQDFWFPANRMMPDPQPFLDAAYFQCTEFFRGHPGFTPDAEPSRLLDQVSRHVWTPPQHADAQRVEKSWTEHQERAAGLQEYESKAIDEAEQCKGCGMPNTIEDGRCTQCGRVAVRVCGCGFTNQPIEGTCRSCGRRLNARELRGI